MVRKAFNQAESSQNNFIAFHMLSPQNEDTDRKVYEKEIVHLYREVTYLIRTSLRNLFVESKEATDVCTEKITVRYMEGCAKLENYTKCVNVKQNRRRHWNGLVMRKNMTTIIKTIVVLVVTDCEFDGFVYLCKINLYFGKYSNI